MDHQVDQMPSISTRKIIKSLIVYQKQEIDMPFYQELTKIGQTLKFPMPSQPLVASFCKAIGRKFSFSSYSATGVKSDITLPEWRGFL